MKLEKIASRIVYNDKTFTKRLVFNEDKVLNFILNFKPGQSLPPHTHENCDLLVHVLTGDGEVTVDETTKPITQGDVLCCKGEEVFSMKNTGDKDMSCFVVIAPNPSAAYSREI